jgi:peptide/nickel transport system permease protein
MVTDQSLLTGAALPTAAPAPSVRRPVTVRPFRPRRLRLTPGGAIGLTTVAVIATLAILGPWILDLTGLDPDKQNLTGRLAPPVWAGGSWEHALGTNALGEDLLARMIAGARVSLLIGVAATVLAGTIGTVLGALAGSAGGWLDRIVTYLTDVQVAAPFVVVAVAVTAALGQSLRNVIVVLVLTGWVGYARIVRLQTLSLRESAFVDAARVSGAGPFRILQRHLLPNLTGPVIVVASQQVAALILYEAALSYLGLGVPGDTITWGGMIAAGRDQLLTDPWVATVPGVAIAFSVLGFNLLGDWLRDVLDPAR